MIGFKGRARGILHMMVQTLMRGQRREVALLVIFIALTAGAAFYTLQQTEEYNSTVFVNFFLPSTASASPSALPTRSPSSSCSPPPSPSASQSAACSPSPTSNPAGSVAKLTPLALAIVFPQFHPTPDNDQLWGTNFTGWTLLRPMPRHVVDQVIYKPHPELGYYNLLDFEHRRFMRVLADQFGIHGFCFYHFWFKDRPVMDGPVELMIKDGEPNKPFVLCWANENWTRTWDGSANEVILEQDYSDHEGNIKHFNHLLPMFRHKRYIRINDRPVFFIYRVDPKDAEAIAGIMELWQGLAVEAGLPGIHFMRFNGPFDSADKPSFAGFAQFEPGFSSRYGTEAQATGPYAGFRLLDAEATWAAAEERKERGLGLREFHRGTFVRFHNAPLRNWTNGNYETYPALFRNATTAGFERHLRRMHDLAANDGATITGPEHFVLLTAWNDWNEQAVLEPNDIDGYDALSAVKRVFKPHTGKTIVHMGHLGGGTEGYTRDLIAMFAEYNHTFVLDGKPPPPSPDIVLLHINSAMVRGGPRWGVLDIVRTYRARGVPIYLTIHDYQWLFPTMPQPGLNVLQATVPDPGCVKNTTELFQAMSKVTFPEHTIYDYYRAKIGDQHWDEGKMEVVPHNGLLTHSDRFFVAPVVNDTINVAFVGQFDGYKGAVQFCNLSSSAALPKAHRPLTFRFHQYGATSGIGHTLKKTYAKTITFHNDYDNKQLESILQEQRIHIVTFLSLFPETFSYALTRILRAGVPVVYLKRGALIERLAGVEHAFAVDGEATLESVEAGVSRAVEFVLRHQGTDTTLRELSPNVQPTKWYLLNYPEVAA